MNRWLTWRARLAHLLDPSCECLCHVCAQVRANRGLRMAEAFDSIVKLYATEEPKCPKPKI